MKICIGKQKLKKKNAIENFDTKRSFTVNLGQKKGRI